uniref:Uncharacterized protein n=1 Tax=Colobus angolensis palliatus TaxID=336983 RepID=A0A2K5KAJ2_COLAP
MIINFLILLGKNLTKIIYTIKEVMHITWVFDIKDGILSWKNDAAYLHVEMTEIVAYFPLYFYF